MQKRFEAPLAHVRDPFDNTGWTSHGFYSKLLGYDDKLDYLDINTRGAESNGIFSLL